MAITNGSTITEADLDAMLSSSLAAVQADNAQLPAGLLIPLWFNGLVAGTAPTRRKAIFVAPFDLIVESVAVQAADFTNPSTLTVTITGDGPLVNWPISVSGSIAAGGVVKLARLLYDNTKTNAAKSFALTSRAYRVFPRGSTITVSVSTTSVAVANTCVVMIACREFYGRD
jgi:hypothetical protein